MEIAPIVERRPPDDPVAFGELLSDPRYSAELEESVRLLSLINERMESIMSEIKSLRDVRPANDAVSE